MTSRLPTGASVAPPLPGRIDSATTATPETPPIARAAPVLSDAPGKSPSEVALALLVATIVLVPIAAGTVVWSAPGGDGDFNRRVTFQIFDLALVMTGCLRIAALLPRVLGDPARAVANAGRGAVRSALSLSITVLGPKKCEELHEQHFAPQEGIADVEVNGSPAVANGRVYLSTSEEIYCIGRKDGKPAPEPKIQVPAPVVGKKPTQLQVIPADVVLSSGASAAFKVRAFDDHGNFLKEVAAAWSLPAPPAPMRCSRSRLFAGSN